VSDFPIFLLLYSSLLESVHPNEDSFTQSIPPIPLSNISRCSLCLQRTLLNKNKKKKVEHFSVSVTKKSVIDSSVVEQEEVEDGEKTRFGFSR